MAEAVWGITRKLAQNDIQCLLWLYALAVPNSQDATASLEYCILWMSLRYCEQVGADGLHANHRRNTHTVRDDTKPFQRTACIPRMQNRILIEECVLHRNTTATAQFPIHRSGLPLKQSIFGLVSNVGGADIHHCQSPTEHQLNRRAKIQQ